MAAWFLILLISVCFSAAGLLVFSKSSRPKLPPGPIHVPIIGPLLFFFSIKSFSDVEPILRNFFSRYGPIVSLDIGHRPAVFIRDPSLAHRTLVQNGAVFADRPPFPPINRVFSSNQHTVSSAPYGNTWRLLRRNLTSQILHPSKLSSFSRARRSVLHILLSRLKSPACSGDHVRLIDHLQYAMFCLLVLMCFGDNVDEKKIEEIEGVQRGLILRFGGFNVLNFWPSVGRVIFRKRWSELYDMRRNQEDVFLPLIRARSAMQLERLRKSSADRTTPAGGGKSGLSYVDTLLNLELPDEKRKLSEGEVVSLCSEFLSAGTDTTSTALQWIMANLVKYPEIQEKLLSNIKEAMSEAGADDEVREEDLHRIPYLKAVVLEALRRHPPSHFLIPHAVTEDVTVEGYLVPKKGSVNIMVAEMGWDPEVWEEPMSFRPERFMNGNRVEAFDVTGSKEIKMMPFGAGRRICPAYGLAMLHLEYFVANLVWAFSWAAVEGDDVDLSEKQEFTVVMKTPLTADVSLRSK